MTLTIESKAFETGGYYIMRSRDLYMIVDCIPLDDKVPSGHIHNNRLGFELFAYDQSFIIDPGSYVYTADRKMRNLFRSTQYHNTVVVDNQEQNRFNSDQPFSVKLDSDVKINKWEVNKKYDLLDAEHTGYLRLNNPVLHRRQIFFNKLDGYWVIEDILTGEGKHQFDLYFHFSPMQVKIEKNYPFVVKSLNEGKSNILIIPLEIKGLDISIHDGWVSHRYGKKEKSSILKYSKNSFTPSLFSTILYPFTGKADIQEIITKINLDLCSLNFQ